MSITGAYRFRGAAYAANVAIVIGALMLLIFPIRAAHHFANHFRTNETRRTVERNLCLQDTPADADGVIVTVPRDPGTRSKAPFETREPSPKLDYVSLERPLTLLCSRLKISPAGDAQDPFLHS